MNTRDETGRLQNLSFPEYQDVRGVPAFEDVALFDERGATCRDGDDLELLLLRARGRPARRAHAVARQRRRHRRDNGQRRRSLRRRAGAIRDLAVVRGEHPCGFYRRLGFRVVGLMPDANGPGKPDIFFAKRVGTV